MKFLITGAARGIGRGLARSLLTKGHSVYLLDNNQAELQHALTLCESWAASTASTTPTTTQKQAPFKGRLVDLSDRSAFPALISDVTSFFNGSLDVLVNNAFATPHTWADGAPVESDGGNGNSIEAQWDLKIAVGLTAPFVLARRLTPLLQRGRTGSSSSASASASAPRLQPDAGSDAAGDSPGCIINISSTRATMAEPDHEAYSAAKAGLLGLTQSLAVSLGGRHGIRVNAILPGWINVENECKAADERGARWEDGLTEQDHAWHPAGRVGKVEDVVRTVLYLAESGFVTGEQITLDGGVTRKMVYPE